jgi:hypothetical protein
MTEQDKEKLAFEHEGDHHLAKIALDPNTKKVSAGGIYNFSANASALLQIIDGKVEGSLIQSGDTHSLCLNAKNDGSLEGTFTDRRNGGIEISFQAGLARLVKGKLPPGGLSITADHHRVNLQLDAEGKVSGAIESRAVKDGTFRIKLEKGKLSGAFIHTGSTHETEISLSPEGWKAAVAFGKGNGKFAFSVEKGKVESKVFGGMKLKF